jgi:wyosine [tRNA(Phe)-imidazoG37] synthetase (radical SAM superfamily)
VLTALRRVDEAYLKLDTADPDVFRRLNGAHGGLPRLLEALRTLPHVTIQSLFARDAEGRVDNTTPEAVERWVGALRVIAPVAVQVYSVDRVPAWSALQPVSPEELESIAARARAAGLAATVY